MTARAAWLLPILAVVAIGAAAAVAFSTGDEPEPLTQLERAQRAGQKAGTARQRIIENLERIEANLGAGAGLTKKSSTIHGLTTRQRRSLEGLIGLLRDQLETLKQTRRSLESTRRTATDLGRLGERQLAVLERTLGALRQLKADVEFSTRTSGELSRLAIYGARLAEDSQKRFDEP